MNHFSSLGSKLAHGISWRLDSLAPKIGRTLGPVTEERLVFFKKHGYVPRLRHPRTFNEKICYRKLFRPPPQAARLADKVGVRSFVEERGFSKILTKLLLVTTNPDEIDFTALPQRFVVKAAHGSGWNIIVRDKSKADLEGIVRRCKEWMATSYSGSRNEAHYADIPRSILVEEFLHDPKHGVPPDYKFFVFHGMCHYVQVDYGRFTDHTRTFYDTDWNVQDFSLEYPSTVVEERPKTLGSMLGIAERLAKGMDFCRVDLYSLNDVSVYFGEMTLTPGGGHDRFYPHSDSDFAMGELW